MANHPGPVVNKARARHRRTRALRWALLLLVFSLAPLLWRLHLDDAATVLAERSRALEVERHQAQSALLAAESAILRIERRDGADETALAAFRSWADAAVVLADTYRGNPAAEQARLRIDSLSRTWAPGFPPATAEMRSILLIFNGVSRQETPLDRAERSVRDDLERTQGLKHVALVLDLCLKAAMLLLLLYALFRARDLER